MKITFKTADGDKSISHEADSETSILDIALAHDIDLDHACGGNAACSTCHVRITKGMENLNEIDEIEEDLIDFAEDADLLSRLACQSLPQKGKDSDIVVELPDQKGLH